jgi:hypothetical protein
VYQGSFFQFTSGTTFSVLSGTFSTNSGSGAPTYSVWYAQNPAPLKVGKEGKDGKERKDGKDKEQKDHKDKEPPDKLPEIQGMEPFLSDPSLASFADEASYASGRSFIEPDERPTLGGDALRDAERER